MLTVWESSERVSLSEPFYYQNLKLPCAIVDLCEKLRSVSIRNYLATCNYWKCLFFKQIITFIFERSNFKLISGTGEREIEER